MRVGHIINCGPVTFRPFFSNMPRIITVRSKGQSEDGILTSPQLFEYVSSMVVLHDGSGQSDRAWQTAMQCVTRSIGTLDFIGIFGIDTRGSYVKVSADDGEWQQGWLNRLADVYSQHAEGLGVTFNSRFLPANDPCLILDLLCRMEFDLLVMPKSLTQFGMHGESLIPSILSRPNVNVLVCP